MHIFTIPKNVAFTRKIGESKNGDGCNSSRSLFFHFSVLPLCIVYWQLFQETTENTQLKALQTYFYWECKHTRVLLCYLRYIISVGFCKNLIKLRTLKAIYKTTSVTNINIFMEVRMHASPILFWHKVTCLFFILTFYSFLIFVK